MKARYLASLALLSIFLLPGVLYAEFPGIRNDTASTTLVGTNLTPTQLATDSKGQLFCTAGTAAASLGKAEDAPHTSGDTGVMGLAVANEALINISGTDGDYTPLATSRKGAIYVDFQQASQSNIAGTPIKVEDAAAGNGDGAISVVYVREDALTTSTSTTGDYSHVKVDGNGRQIVTMAPPGEFFQSCSSVNSGTSDTAIKAAVASNRIYVTSIACSNTSAVASQITFKDGATAIYTGAVATQAANGGGFDITLPVPLRGSVNTALNFAMTTTATATTCCAAGYVSVL